MVRTARRSALLALAVCSIACEGKEPRSPATPPPTASAPAASAPAAAPDAGVSAEPAPEPRKRRPFEVYNTCSDVVTVVFAEEPKAPGAGRRTIAPSASIDGPRDSEGNQTVWLLDANGEPLVRVHVTRGMKRVEIGKSCRTLDAR